MTTYTIDNGSPVGKAFKVLGGHTIIKPGEKGEVDTLYPLTEAKIDALAQDKVKVTEAKAKAGRDPLDHDDSGKKGGSLPKADDEKKA